MDAHAHSLQDQAQAIDTCVLFVLLWIAGADGETDPAANEPLREYLQGVHEQSVDIDDLLTLIHSDDEASYLDICRRLRDELDGEGRQFLLELSIRVATAASNTGATGNSANSTRKPSTPANLILRFFADLFELDLPASYQAVTGSPLPDPGDPSSVEWWEVEELRGKAHTWKGVHEDSLTMTRAEALVVLGLEHDANKRDIKQAYRRLVHLHHPDKFATDEERSKEQQAFLRVRRAYEVLKS